MSEVLVPYPHQFTLAVKGIKILREHGLVYYAMEERTGKTLTAIITAEAQESAKRVLVITKKGKPYDGWIDTLANFPHEKVYQVTTFHMAKKVIGKFDLVIIDEAHNYISGYPVQSPMNKQIAVHTRNLPIIYCSATPRAQGTQMLYHQFKLSVYSPWKEYETFYQWFRAYGIPSSIWVQGRELSQYNKTIDSTYAEVEHLFITATRKQLGFEHEPQDVLHYVELNEKTKNLYNILVKKRVAIVNDDIKFTLDTKSKMRFALHMLEGGVAKIGDDYHTLPNREKVDYILKEFGDSENLVIMYFYKQEEHKLKAVFKKATILQSSTFAEGVDLSSYAHLVIYSQDWSTAKHSQRRARQANMKRDTKIDVHFLLVKKAISEGVYTAVSLNKVNYIDSMFNEETI